MNTSMNAAKSVAILSGATALVLSSALGASGAAQAFSQPSTSDGSVDISAATKKQQRATLTPKQIKSIYGQRQRVAEYSDSRARKTTLTTAVYANPADIVPMLLAATMSGKGKNGPKLNLSETVAKEDKIITYQYNKRSKIGSVLVKRSVTDDSGEKLLLLTMTRVDRNKAVVAFVLAAKSFRKPATKAIDQTTKLLANQGKLRT